MGRQEFFTLMLLAIAQFALLASASTLDPLRTVRSDISTIDPFTRIVVFALSVVVLAIALLAYARSKSKRILLVTAAFGFFSLKWLFKVLDIFLTPGMFLTDPLENVFEFLILLLLAVAIFKR